MRKEKILEILENAKDGNGAVPMRLVRTAFDKLPEPCEDTISRQTAIDAVNNAFDRETLLTGFVRSIAVRAIRNMPSAQPERKTGHWIAPKYYPTQFTFTCSKCGYKQSFNGKFKFCPNCGADMRGEQE